jgi:alkyldihydroxyacetonephosphate synthase
VVQSHLKVSGWCDAQPFVPRLQSLCAHVRTADEALAEASRDWWPLAMHWTLAGEVPSAASVVCRPADAAEVAAVVALCNTERIPVTVAGGRSGVCGASLPVFGGVVLDVTALTGIVAVDETSLVVDVGAGTFGHHLEAELRSQEGVTLGHWPQSIELSTVGGWLACRSAG